MQHLLFLFFFFICVTLLGVGKIRLANVVTVYLIVLNSTDKPIVLECVGGWTVLLRLIGRNIFSEQLNYMLWKIDNMLSYKSEPH